MARLSCLTTPFLVANVLLLLLTAPCHGSDLEYDAHNSIHGFSKRFHDIQFSTNSDVANALLSTVISIPETVCRDSSGKEACAKLVTLCWDFIEIRRNCQLTCAVCVSEDTTTSKPTTRRSPSTERMTSEVKTTVPATTKSTIVISSRKTSTSTKSTTTAQITKTSTTNKMTAVLTTQSINTTIFTPTTLTTTSLSTSTSTTTNQITKTSTTNKMPTEFTTQYLRTTKFATATPTTTTTLTTSTSCRIAASIEPCKDSSWLCPSVVAPCKDSSWLCPSVVALCALYTSTRMSCQKTCGCCPIPTTSPELTTAATTKIITSNPTLKPGTAHHTTSFPIVKAENCRDIGLLCPVFILLCSIRRDVQRSCMKSCGLCAVVHGTFPFTTEPTPTKTTTTKSTPTVTVEPSTTVLTTINPKSLECNDTTTLCPAFTNLCNSQTTVAKSCMKTCGLCSA